MRRQSPGFMASKPEPVITPSSPIFYCNIKIAQLLEFISELLLLSFTCLSRHVLLFNENLSYKGSLVFCLSLLEPSWWVKLWKTRATKPLQCNEFLPSRMAWNTNGLEMIWATESIILCFWFSISTKNSHIHLLLRLNCLFIYLEDFWYPAWPQDYHHPFPL